MGVHPQDIESWIRYKKGLCNGCNAGCCSLPVEVRAEDLIRLGWISEEETEDEFLLDSAMARLMRERKIMAFRSKTGIAIIEQFAGRDCFLLDQKTRLCTVYEKRPGTCRQFPRVGPRPGFCPHSKSKAK